METKNKVRVGLIGCGNIAGRHAANLAKIESATLVACVDTQENHARALAKSSGSRTYTDYRRMLDQEKLDAVILCTPHFLRREPIAAVAERKVALFCEKPPAFTLEDARACIGAIEKAGILNTVGLMYRWAEITDKVRDLIAGRPVNICQITGCWAVIYWVTEGGLAKWFLQQDQSGGPMLEQGIHLLDAARCILRDDVVEVHAFGSNTIVPKRAEITIHDTVQANLRFAKGTTGTHVHSWAYRGWIFQIRFIGQDFELLWDIANNRIEGKTRGVEVRFQGKDDPYVTEMEGFVKAVAARDQKLLRCTYADACQSFATTYAAVQSALTGTVQRVPQVTA